MAGELLTRCGYRCDLCLAYRENVEKEDRRALLSDGWQKYFGFRIEPEDIVCDGCLKCDCDNPRLLDPGCPVRPCVIGRGIENCSQCGEFPCGKLQERLVDFDAMKSKFGSIPAVERKLFLSAYENRKRLSYLRQSNGEYPRMTNRELVPDVGAMSRFIGGECSPLWNGLIDRIRSTYSYPETILFGGPKYGWAIQFKQNKSKTLFTLYPERTVFAVLIVYGAKELEQVEANVSRLSPAAVEMVKSTPHLHDGKWIWFRVKDKQDLDDLHVLMECKKMPQGKVGSC